MHNIHYILFDLDGTLTESGRGIMNAVRYALLRYGLEIPSEETLRRYIGPPLDYSFRTYAGMSDNDAWEAVLVYREYYNTKGVYENDPYPGVPEMLAELKSRGYSIAVASSKPQNMVDEVLRHFDLAGYFDVVIGATDEGVMSDKVDLINAVCGVFAEREGKDIGIIKEQTVMAGDRCYDIDGAHEAGVPVIGVRYGYAPEGELEEHGADMIAEDVPGLLKILTAE